MLSYYRQLLLRISSDTGDKSVREKEREIEKMGSICSKLVVEVRVV